MERITGFALRSVLSWTPFEFSWLVLVVGLLIIPEWPSVYFWPLLRDEPTQFKSFVREVFVLPARKDLIMEGPGQRQIYKSLPSVFHGSG